jgi:hypothetical protein
MAIDATDVGERMFYYLKLKFSVLPQFSLSLVKTVGLLV